MGFKLKFGKWMISWGHVLNLVGGEEVGDFLVFNLCQVCQWFLLYPLFSAKNLKKFFERGTQVPRRVRIFSDCLRFFTFITNLAKFLSSLYLFFINFLNNVHFRDT